MSQALGEHDEDVVAEAEGTSDTRATASGKTTDEVLGNDSVSGDEGVEDGSETQDHSPGGQDQTAMIPLRWTCTLCGGGLVTFTTIAVDAYGTLYIMPGSCSVCTAPIPEPIVLKQENIVGLAARVLIAQNQQNNAGSEEEVSQQVPGQYL